MNNDIEGVTRYIAVYDKKIDGSIKNKYLLTNVNLEELRKLFKIDTFEQDPAVRDIIDFYYLSDKELKFLEKYAENHKIESGEYDFYLECCQAPGSNWEELSKKYGYYPAPTELLAFPDAIEIKPNENNTKQQR